MKFKFDIKREIKIVAAVMAVVSIIAFTERKQANVSVHDINVRMVNINENHFLDESDILGLMELNRDNLKGASLDAINMREVEQKDKT